MRIVGLSSFNPYVPAESAFPKIINPQIYAFKDNGRIYVYSPLFNAAAMLSVKEYEFLTNNEEIVDAESIPGDLRKLTDSFLYMGKCDADNIALKLDPYRKADSEKMKTNVTDMVLILTNMCNLRCKYCFVFGGEPSKLAKFRNLANIKQQNIDIDTALFAIKEFKPKSLFIFGWGEPTLAFDKLKQILDQIDTNTTTVSIDTNGVYLGRRSEIIKYFIEKKVYMHISYDGLPSVNDKYRITANGKGSSSEIVATIKEISKYGPFNSFADIRATVTKGQEDRIIDSINHLISLGINEASYSPIEAVGRAIGSSAEPPDLPKLARNVAKAVIYARKIGFRLTSAILPALNDGVMQEFGCNLISGKAITLGLDGSIYSCLDPLEELKIGSISKTQNGHALNIDWAKLSNIAETRHVSNLKNCQTCPVKCGGGCAKRAYDTYQSFEVNSDDVNMCNSKRFALIECIKNLFEEDESTLSLVNPSHSSLKPNIV